MSATATRTDIHRPSAPEFDPTAYDFSGVVFDGRADWPQENEYFFQVRRELLEQGFTFSGVHGGNGQCDHCGSLLRYSALMIHRPTRTLIYVGEQCLDNRFENMTKAEFARARKTASLHAERTRKADRIAALVDAHPLLAELTYGAEKGVVHFGSSDFLHQLSQRLMGYGELSERQIDAAEKSITRIIG